MLPGAVARAVSDVESPVEVTIREAVQADLLDVVRIEKASFPQPWPFSAFEGFLDQPGFLVAERQPGPVETPDVVGYVVADTVPNHGTPIGHVKDLAVRPDARGDGVGSTLLDRALAVMAAEGARNVKLEVREGNDAAISLYRSRGFEYRRTVPRYYDNGDDAYVLVRDGAPRGQSF